MTTESKTYIYIDESGSLSGTELYFVVATVLSQSPKSLEHITKRVRRKIGRKKLKQIPELKFHTSDETTRRRLLTTLAKQRVNFLTLLVDKEGRRVKDNPENYGLILKTLTSHFPKNEQTEFLVDQKFTKEREVERLKREVADPRVLFVDSKRNPFVQLADFVAGAVNHYFNFGNKAYFQIIEAKTKVKKVSWAKLKEKALAPRGSVGPM